MSFPDYMKLSYIGGIGGERYYMDLEEMRLYQRVNGSVFHYHHVTHREELKHAKKILEMDTTFAECNRDVRESRLERVILALEENHHD